MADKPSGPGPNNPVSVGQSFTRLEYFTLPLLAAEVQRKGPKLSRGAIIECINLAQLAMDIMEGASK